MNGVQLDNIMCIIAQKYCKNKMNTVLDKNMILNEKNKEYIWLITKYKSILFHSKELSKKSKEFNILYEWLADGYAIKIFKLKINTRDKKHFYGLMTELNIKNTICKLEKVGNLYGIN